MPKAYYHALHRRVSAETTSDSVTFGTVCLQLLDHHEVMRVLCIWCSLELSILMSDYQPGKQGVP